MVTDQSADADLRKKFEDCDSYSVVALIDYLASPTASVRSIDSITIRFSELMDESWISAETQQASALQRLRSLHGGSKDGSVTPLQWLEGLSEVFEQLSPRVQARFEDFCLACLDFVQARPVAHVKIFMREGIFRLPWSDYREDMTIEELEPYRVERSLLDDDNEPRDD